MVRRLRVVLFVAVVVATAVVLRAGARAADDAHGDLTVEVTGFESGNGSVRAGLFESNDGFPLGVDDTAPIEEAEIEDGTAILQFESVEHGSYAVVAYHDVNDNDVLDTNLLGMPREGAGVYRPVQSRFPPPTFDDCDFEFDEETETVSIELNHL